MTIFSFGVLPSRKIAYPVTSSYNSKTGEISERVVLAGRPSYDSALSDGDSIDEAIARLVEIKSEAASLGLVNVQIKEDSFYNEMRDREEDVLMIVGSRSTSPGDADYPSPEEFTPELDKVYVKRTWTETDVIADERLAPAADTDGFNVNDGIVAGLALEKMGDARRFPREGSINAPSNGALDRLILLDRERALLGLEADADLEMFFAPDGSTSSTGEIVAIVSEGGVPVRRFTAPLTSEMTAWSDISLANEIDRSFSLLRYY